MKNLLFIIVFFLMANMTTGQDMTSAADNDPTATKILDKLKKEYDSYSSMKVSFDLVMDFQDGEREIQKGSVIQQGKMFKMDIGERSIYSNGEYTWVHIKKNKEVQINDADMEEGTNMLSPKDMLSLYSTGKYVYAIIAEPLLDGKKVTQIDFKPLDKYSEFSKMSLYVDKITKKMAQMKVFSKDGSRYTLIIDDIVANKKYDLATFVFDESKFPDIHVEDLRID